MTNCRCTGIACETEDRERFEARDPAGGPVGGQCYKRRQTNAIPITPREPLLQTSSSKPKTAIFSEKALGLTTFVTTGQKARRKTPWIDDVCNNTHPSTPKTQRTRRDSMATLKPTTPLRATNKGPLKPTSPLHPKTAPKTPISHPQRRWRFHSHTGISEQRRWRFQTTGPAGLQGLAATPARSYKPTPQKTRMQFD